MQIRAQLRKQAVSMAKYPGEYEPCCFTLQCASGYHGVHARVRFKSRMRNHGTKVGQSGRKQG